MADTTHKLPDGWVIPLPGATDLPSAGASSTVRRSDVGRLLQIPGYEVRRELARGGMGVVLEAWSQRHARAVALKLLVGPLDEELVTRFRREAEAAARLQHPNVVCVLEAGEAAGCPYLVMELVEGRTLEALVKERGPLPEPEAARMVRELADALAHAHGRGVLHRDLKPANVIVEPDGRPRLVDFGLARLADELARLTQTGAILGTPAYMSPEQALGHHGQVGPQTDVYSLGALLYHALTGSPPFVAKSAIGTIEAVARARPVPPDQLRPGVDPDLAAICLRCLEKGPEARWPGAEALRDALLAWERSSRVRPRRARRPGKGAIALASALGLLGLALAGTLLARRRGDAASSTSAAPPSTAAAEAVPPELLTLLAGPASEASLERALALAERVGLDPARLEPDRAAALAFARFLRARRTDLDAGDLDALRAAPSPWRELAELEALADAGLAPEAALELAGRLAPALPRLGRIRLAAARALHALSREEEGIAEASRAIELAQEHPEPRYWLALALGYEDPGSLAALEAAIQLAPEGSALQLRALDRRAQQLLGAGDLERAVADLDLLLQHDPGRAPAVILRGHAHLEAGRKDRAAADLRRARELDPPGAEELRMMGVLAVRLEGPLAGLECLQRAVEADPGLVEGRLDLAGALLELRWLDAAKASVVRAVELAPDSVRARMVMAQVLDARGRHGEALEHARRAFRLQPTAEAGAMVEALERIAAATAGWIDPDRREALVDQLAVRYEETGSDAELLALLDEILALAPADSIFRLLRSKVRDRAGDREGAAEDALAHPVGRLTGLATARLALALAHLRFVEDAKRLLLGALLKVPSDVDCRQALLTVRYLAGEREDAEREAAQLLEVLPAGHAHEVDARWVRGSCRFERRQFEQALEDLRRVRELNLLGAPMGFTLERIDAAIAGVEKELGR